MHTIALIGFLGGLITGISPCILPYSRCLPIRRKQLWRATFRGAALSGDRGLVCSFSVVTLAGSALLSALHLPQDAIRWTALVVLVLIAWD